MSVIRLSSVKSRSKPITSPQADIQAVVSVMGHMNIMQLSFYKLRQIDKKKGARRQTPLEKLSRSIISENTQILCMDSSKKHLRIKTCCVQTMTECAKVRQATVFLAQLGPIETK